MADMRGYARLHAPMPRSVAWFLTVALASVPRLRGTSLVSSTPSMVVVPQASLRPFQHALGDKATFDQSRAFLQGRDRPSTRASLLALRSRFRMQTNRVRTATTRGATVNATKAESFAPVADDRSMAASASGISPTDLTPLGIALIVLQFILTPPMLYLTIGIVLICCCGCIISIFWDSMKEYVFAVLDFIAFVVRTIVTICKGIFWTIKRLTYPFKECLLTGIERVDHCFHPYKVRTPFESKNVPAFRF